MINSLIVKKTDTNTKIIKGFINLFGTDADLKKLTELNEMGIISITGYIISENTSNGNLLVFLSIVILVLLLINIRLCLRRELSIRM
ncbi:MAG: hypothetical protein QXG00_05560 [Candidatus Woesearchaeota archaeon]